MTQSNSSIWLPYLDRFAEGKWRAPIFRDMLLADIKRIKGETEQPTVLDIGCGRGFDDDLTLQQSLAEASGEYMGIEPDVEIPLGSFFSRTCRCIFEQASIPENSVDLAFSVMVMEHIRHPAIFWEKLHTVLKPGGVYWGFTVEKRHPFAVLSLLMGKLGAKDRYLGLLRKSESEEYENYPVCYRANTPAAIRNQTLKFSRTEFIPLRRKENMDYYLPRRLQCLGRLYGNLAHKLNLPISILVTRVVK